MTHRRGAAVELDAGGFNELRMCRNGPMLYNKNDVFVGRSLQKYGEFSWLEEDLFRQLVGAGHVVVDAGANIGSHTVSLSRLVGPGGVVLAFEPQRLVFQVLCANLALNQCANVFAFQNALGAAGGELLVPAMDPSRVGNFGGLSLPGQSAGERVAMRTLDEFEFKACQFLKADVEGMELEVLAGAEATIRRCRPILYLENDRDARSKALLDKVFGLDYVAYWHLPRLFNPDNYFGDAEDIFPGIVSINVLCVPLELKVAVDGFEKVLSPDDHWSRASQALLTRGR